MDDADLFRPRLSTRAKVARGLFGASFIPTLLAAVDLAVSHPSGTGQGAYAMLFFIAVAIGALANLVGLVVASSSRWRGYGEAKMAFLCVGGIFGLPVLAFGLLNGLT